MASTASSALSKTIKDASDAAYAPPAPGEFVELILSASEAAMQTIACARRSDQPRRQPHRFAACVCESARQRSLPDSADAVERDQPMSGSERLSQLVELACAPTSSFRRARNRHSNRVSSGPGVATTNGCASLNRGLERALAMMRRLLEAYAIAIKRGSLKARPQR